MFEGFSYSSIGRLLVPDLDVSEVASNVVNAVQREIPHLLLPNSQLPTAALAWLIPTEPQLVK
jgi:hypothetical protein